MIRILLLALGVSLTSAAPAAEVPFVNFENHPVHALDLSPDGRTLAIAHTADNRVQLFDLSGDTPHPAGSVMVGLDPVSVRFRGNDELWVVNHVSDSVSIVDLPNRRVKATLATADEPWDLVFANGRAFVSCSTDAKLQVFSQADPGAAPETLALAGREPRALALSKDGRSVYAAFFTSGNGTTILAGGFRQTAIVLPNAVSDTRGPYGGQNPPPNNGAVFNPPRDTSATPPAVGLIVRQGGDGRWRDDNRADWTDFVSGPLASASGRIPGWTLNDRDLAIVDAASLAVRYESGLLNIGMALAINPASGEATLVGTEATNEIRFEPIVNGKFVRVKLARVGADGAHRGNDLNPQLDYSVSTVAKATRDQALGDPRAIVWSADGSRGFVAGMGSNNVAVINADGSRNGAPILVGQGPAGLALDPAHHALYVWNHFDASLSVVDTDSRAERDRIAVFNPLPAVVRNGRPLLYDTHRTSGLGQAACGSCHVDSRTDGLSWDLGNPAAPPAAFDQNCGTTVLVTPTCEAYHAMKGPMTTQTLEDIIGHEPLHWRGDRAGIEAFNPAFVGLLGGERPLNSGEMADFKRFLATITLPPNPYRYFDNSLPDRIALPGQYTSGRFQMAGLPLPDGNARNGLNLFSRSFLDTPFQCASCHTLPTGMAVNGPLLTALLGISAGGSKMALGPNAENHLGIVSVDGSTNASIKVPQLRTQYRKTGFELRKPESKAGFGLLHDGSVDSLSDFFSARAFSVRSDQDVADLVALMLAFSGSDFGDNNPSLGAEPPTSKDVPAAVGNTLTYSGGALPFRVSEMIQVAKAGRVDLVVRSGAEAHAYNPASDRFIDGAGTARSPGDLAALASAARPLSYEVVPKGLATRLALDRDGDGISDAAELAQGSDPTDATSTTLRPAAGLWYNAARSGHGFDIESVGDQLFVLWYTYEDDGRPTWYEADGRVGATSNGNLYRVTWNPTTRRFVVATVGTMNFTFADASHGQVSWRIGSRSGSEPITPIAPTSSVALDRTGAWYDSGEPGWGISIDTRAGVRTAILFFYDGDNQPRWALGQDEGSAGTLPMFSYRGFCPDCAYAAPTRSASGSIDLTYDADRRARIRTDVFDASQPAAPWRRDNAAIAPLTDAPAHFERR